MSVRKRYIHKGLHYPHPLRLNTADFMQTENQNGEPYVAMIPAGKVADGELLDDVYLTQQELEYYQATGGYIKGCGTESALTEEDAKIIAESPRFFSSIMCLRCNKLAPIAEFHWKDDEDKKVGS